MLSRGWRKWDVHPGKEGPSQDKLSGASTGLGLGLGQVTSVTMPTVRDVRRVAISETFHVHDQIEITKHQLIIILFPINGRQGWRKAVSRKINFSWGGLFSAQFRPGTGDTKHGPLGMSTNTGMNPPPPAVCQQVEPTHMVPVKEAALVAEELIIANVG